ncbi:maleylpyruvate isomerase N-terminal domain-containing protein [Mycobacterium sp. AZCC_0083]|uniref:maleylpyruvate isomerase N-terminal domain-containing protein n=1 Tax=Mycobacterium sp. AZCC_0083 TaxID=2735882 RepID=UPI001C849092|nr:maleylpyruvate isomerase N-terminal domain-containing protein [Mycobacterium sp. AZCC_0083]
MTSHAARHTPDSPAAQPESHRSVPVVALDRDAARSAIWVAVRPFTALLRETDDIGRLAAGTSWTVAETAAHVSTVLTAFSTAITGQAQALTPNEYLHANFHTRLAATNAATIAMVDHTDAGQLAELITAGAQRFLEIAAAADPQMECETPWYGAARTRTPDCLTALALGELTVHGYDIATGTGRAWPISAEHAKLIVGTVCPQMLPLAVRPEAARGTSLTYEVRLRSDGPRYVISVADGTAEVRAVGGPVDCVISADPVTLLLVVYGRMSLGRALLSGGILSWGRRPWLGLRLKKMFFNP